MHASLKRTRQVAAVIGSTLALAGLMSVSMVSEIAAVPAVSAASLGSFLKIDGIDGESVSKGHRGEIDVLSWSWGVSNSGSMASGGGTGLGAGKVSFQDFHITKYVYSASPSLFAFCASGDTLDAVTLVAPDPRGEDMVRYTLSDVSCGSFTHGGSSSERPTESLSLNFTKIKMEYRDQDSRTKKAINWSTVGWDLATNKKL